MDNACRRLDFEVLFTRDIREAGRTFKSVNIDATYRSRAPRFCPVDSGLEAGPFSAFAEVKKVLVVFEGSRYVFPCSVRRAFARVWHEGPTVSGDSRVAQLPANFDKRMAHDADR